MFQNMVCITYVAFVIHTQIEDETAPLREEIPIR